MNIVEQLKQKSIEHVRDLEGKTVLLRIDVNTSLGDNNQVEPGEDWRIIKSLATIEYLQDRGARTIILAHSGRDQQESLRPIFTYISEMISDVSFCDSFGKEAFDICVDGLQNGQVLMMENVRQHPGEKDNDTGYLKPIIDICDIYVNDAFSVSHRKHASIHAVTFLLPSYFGLQFLDEVQHISQFMNYTEGIKLLILGGAKFDTKLPLLEKMLPQVDYVLMGGALANVFLKGRGFEIGASFCDDVDISHMVDNQKIILPIDYIDQHGDVADIYDVSENDVILDIGPMTATIFNEVIKHAGSLMWNGPMGKYEEGYTEGSIHIAEHISESEAFAITGGGDTSTLILEHDLADNFDFMSTGGGAMLDFLVDATLPGIEVILEKKENI